MDLTELVETLEARHVTVKIAAHDAGTLQIDAPEGVIDDELRGHLRRWKPALLDRLRPRPKVNTPPMFTPGEAMMLEGAPPALRASVEAIKSAFAGVGVELLSVTRDPTWPRHRIADAIRAARRHGDHDRATAIRDGWRERVAVCMIDGGTSRRRAEAIAADEMETSKYYLHNSKDSDTIPPWRP